MLITAHVNLAICRPRSTIEILGPNHCRSHVDSIANRRRIASQMEIILIAVDKVRIGKDLVTPAGRFREGLKAGITAWVVDDTGFPKQGADSVGVDRQYSGTLGKTGNCQVAVSLHHVGEQGNAVLGWRLNLPETWTQDQARRQAAGIPEGVVFKKKWELALELIDQVRCWGVADRIVLTDGGYGEATEFWDALEERRLRYAVAIAPTVGVWVAAPAASSPEARAWSRTEYPRHRRGVAPPDPHGNCCRCHFSGSTTLS